MAQTETDGLEVLETREWVDSLDYVLEKGGPNRAGRLLQQLALHARREAGVNLPFTATTPYQNTIPSQPAAAVSRQPGDGTPHQEPGPLERAGHGRPRQQDSGRHRRTHLDFRLRRHAVRSCLQPFLPRANRKRRPRHRLFPGPRRSRNLFPRLSRRPHLQREAAKLPPRTEARRRTSVPIRIPGSCPISGSFPPSPWDSARSRRSTTRASSNISRTAA